MKAHPVIEQLDVDPLDPDQVVSGEPETSELTLLETDDEGTSGLWQLTPGTVTDTEVDESFLVLSGRGQVIFEDGSRILLEPGVTHRFSGGEKTTWTVEKTILKVYWIA